MICWKYISPLALFIVLIALIAQQSQSPPTYSQFVGCLQVNIYFICCKSRAIFMYLTDYGVGKKLSEEKGVALPNCVVWDIYGTYIGMIWDNLWAIYGLHMVLIWDITHHIKHV